MSNLDILQKIYDYELIQYEYLKKYPKGEKFALVTEIKILHTRLVKNY